MRIDYSSFEKALAQLESSLRFLRSATVLQEEGLRDVVRGGAIQAFEYTYELAVKMIRRQLAAVVPTPAELKALDFMDQVRLAAQAGLVSDVEGWFEFREMRNTTSHTYDAARAERVLGIMDRYLAQMHLLLAQLRRRNDAAD